MTIGVIGAGNVGSALLMELARRGPDAPIEVCCRSVESAEAAILDAGSAFPLAPTRMRPVGRLSDDVHIAVVTAGVQQEASLEHSDVLRLNTELAIQSLAEVRRSDLIVVLVGSPVDEVTECFAAARPDLDISRIIGFGGALDRCRLVRALYARGRDAQCTVVGEHGARAIPVFDDEIDFDAIASEVRSTLARIRTGGSKARNLASGVHLAELLGALSHPKPMTNCVTTYDEGFDLFLTWPVLVSSSGVVSRLDVKLGPRAQAWLDELVQARRLAAHDRRRRPPPGTSI